MPFISGNTSIRKALILAIMLVAALSFMLATSVFTYMDVKEQKARITKQVHTYSAITAFDAQAAVLFNDSDTQKQRLNAFNTVDIIKNIHIYRIDPDTQQVELFSSYNAPGSPPTPAKIGQIEAYRDGVMSSQQFEVTKPITSENTVIGYVYMRASLNSIHTYITEKLLFALALSLVGLLIAYVIARLFHTLIGKPLNNLSQLLKEVAKNKNYTVRANKARIKELSQLAVSINTMLRRTQKQLERQEQDKTHIEALNHTLEHKVNMRTEALKEANQELLSTLERMHEYQNQIIETEKMASLGQMIAGIAHEVNTPLGLAITSSSLVSDKLVQLQSAFENKTLTSKELAQYLSDTQQSIELIGTSLTRSANLVTRFKQLAVNQSAEQPSQVHLATFLDDILLSMRTELSDINPTIDVTCPSALTIKVKAVPLQQVLQQLITNALMHAFANTDNPSIIINASLDASHLHIDFVDNGKGIDEAMKRRLFDPFVTSKRTASGGGLGLHLVYNLVTQALGGSVQLNTSSHMGAHFHIVIPVSQGES